MEQTYFVQKKDKFSANEVKYNKLSAFIDTLQNKLNEFIVTKSIYRIRTMEEVKCAILNVLSIYGINSVTFDFSSVKFERGCYEFRAIVEDAKMPLEIVVGYLLTPKKFDGESFKYNLFGKAVVRESDYEEGKDAKIYVLDATVFSSEQDRLWELR